MIYLYVSGIGSKLEANKTIEIIGDLLYVSEISVRNIDYNKIIVVLSMIIVVLIVVGVIMLNPFTPKTDTQITVVSNNVLYNGYSFSISLTDINNVSISNQKVNIIIKDANGTENRKTIVTE